MEGFFRNVTALEVGTWDFKGDNGEEYRYIVVYDPESRENLTVSLDADCTPPAVEFGTKIDMWIRLSQADKVVRGERNGRANDRTINQLKLKAVSIELAKQSAGSADKSKLVAAAA